MAFKDTGKCAVPYPIAICLTHSIQAAVKSLRHLLNLNDSDILRQIAVDIVHDLLCAHLRVNFKISHLTIRMYSGICSA